MSCRKALSVRSYSLKSVVDAWYTKRMSMICGPMECSGITGLGPGLTWTTKIEADKVAYMAG